MTLKSYALVLEEEFKRKGYNLPTTVAPNFLVKFYGFFDKTVKFVVPILGSRCRFSNDRFIQVLEIQPVDYRKSIIDMAYDMIEKGIITKRY